MITADPYTDIEALQSETRRLHEQTARRFAAACRMLAAAASAPGSLATTATLSLDGDGQIWIVVESELTVTDTRLGAVDDDATMERVPAGLQGRLEELRVEWAEWVEFGQAIRDEVKASFRAGTEGSR